MVDPIVRKFVELVRVASGKWPNWDPPIPIIVGDYGTLDENGELDVLGNVYKDPEILKSLKDNGVDLNLTDNQPGFGEPETDFIVSSSGVKKGQLNVDQSVTIPHVATSSINGTWKFRDGKRGALVILHSPCQTFIPKPVLTKLLKVGLLKDKHVVTSALACPAYFMCLSDKCEKISVSFSPKAVGGTVNSDLGAGWWTDAQDCMIRNAFNESDKRCFVPLVSLRKMVKPSWLRWRSEEEPHPHPADEYIWQDVYPSWGPLDEDGGIDGGELDEGGGELDEDGDQINVVNELENPLDPSFPYFVSSSLNSLSQYTFVSFF